MINKKARKEYKKLVIRSNECFKNFKITFIYLVNYYNIFED